MRSIAGEMQAFDAANVVYNRRTAALIKQLKPAAHLAISGRTMEFDGKGRCVAGC